MSFYLQYKVIDDIFCEDSNWLFNYDKLANLTSENFAKEVLDFFNASKEHNHFKAQIVKASSIKPFVELIIVSIGHSLCSRHYTFNPNNGDWILTSINQELFKNIVEPFHKEIEDDFYRWWLGQEKNILSRLNHQSCRCTNLYFKNRGEQK
jgi:hypothetical protein